MENMVDFKKKFKGRKILITGHTGFKGSWLSRMLLNWGARVCGIGLPPHTDPNLFEAIKIKREIKNYFVDIRDFSKIKSVIAKEKPEIVFHLAAQPIVRESYANPLYTLDTNILGTANVLQAVKEAGGIKSVIIVTTDKVYKNNETGRPFREDDKLGGHDPYSASKAAVEILVDSYSKSFFNPADYGKKHETLISSARAGNVIGGGDWNKDRLVPDLVKGVFQGERFMIRNPDAVRPWQHVLEALCGYTLLATKLHEGRREFSGGWNFGPSCKNFLNVREFVELATGILGRGDYTIMKTPDNNHEDKLLTLNSAKARKNLGWKQRLNLDKTLALTFEWYKNFYDREDVGRITDKQIESFFNNL